MLSEKEINKVKKRIEWLNEYFFEPIVDLTLEIAETDQETRDIEGLPFFPIEPEMRWGREWGLAWFKGTYSLDQVQEGELLLFDIDVGGESVVYIDGNVIGAIDREHKQIPLLGDELIDGEHHILIKSYAGHHMPSVTPSPKALKKGGYSQRVFERARIVRRNDYVWHLYYDLQTLMELALTLPDDSLRKAKILRRLYEAVDLVTWETGGKYLEREELIQARKHIAPLLQLQNGPTSPTINMIGHAHIDVAWLWPLAETIRKCERTFSTQLRMMQCYPEYKFLQSQPQLYEFTEKYYPQVFQSIKEAIEQGRWEAGGGMWVEADCNVPSSESLIRQFLLGKTYFNEKFGKESRFLWLPDVFGYSGNLPQIMKGCDVDFFITSKINWNDTNIFPYDIFLWRGIDGSEVLTHFITGTYNGSTRPDALATHWKNFKQKEVSENIVHAVGFGDGGGGMTMDLMEFAARLKDLEGAPKSNFCFVEDLMEELERNREDYPIWDGELYLEFHRGTFTSQAWTKRNNRKCEYLLRETEFFATLAYLEGQGYPADQLREVWKPFLTNQFHDILPGSSINKVYEDAKQSYGEIAMTCTSILDEALNVFVLSKDMRNAEDDVLARFAVWNTLNWDRRGRIRLTKFQNKIFSKIGDFVPALNSPISEDMELSDNIVVFDEAANCYLPTQVIGDEVVFLSESIPGVGYRVFSLRKLNGGGIAELHTQGVLATLARLENNYIRVELDEHGQIVSIYDKEANREVLPKGEKANVLIMAEDIPNKYDAWDIDHFYQETEVIINGGEEIELITAGPIEGRIRVKRSFGKGSTWTQDIILGCEDRGIDFETSVDWQEDHRVLKVSFPVDVRTREAAFEIQGGYLTRSTHENTSWDRAQFEVCGHKWADLSENGYGAALLNDCKYGYDVKNSDIRLTLLKSARGPDLEADRGMQVFVYSFLPHIGDLVHGKVIESAHELNVPYRIKTLDKGVMLPPEGRAFSIEGEGIFLQALKKEEKGEGLILRFGERAGKRSKVRLSLPFQGSRIIKTNMLEREERVLAEHACEVTLEVRPFEIVTVKIEK
jgi:alpha-mannosidase